MPVITVQMHKVTPIQKADLIRDLTASAVAATGIPAASFIVLLQELDETNIGIGGRNLAEVRAAL